MLVVGRVVEAEWVGERAAPGQGGLSISRVMLGAVPLCLLLLATEQGPEFPPFCLVLLALSGAA